MLEVKNCPCRSLDMKNASGFIHGPIPDSLGCAQERERSQVMSNRNPLQVVPGVGKEEK